MLQAKNKTRENSRQQGANGPAPARRRRKKQEEVAASNTMSLQLVSPAHCVVSGLSKTARPGTESSFTIAAHNGRGERKATGGESFFVAIRGASTVRARVVDNADGSYEVRWKPTCSGGYKITISLFGVSISGSPFTTEVSDTLAYTRACSVRGAGLHQIIARAPSSFEVLFKDRNGAICRAAEVDVFVVPMPPAPPGPPAEAEPVRPLKAAMGFRAVIAEAKRVEKARLAAIEAEKAKEMTVLGSAWDVATAPVFDDVEEKRQEGKDAKGKGKDKSGGAFSDLPEELRPKIEKKEKTRWEKMRLASAARRSKEAFETAGRRTSKEDMLRPAPAQAAALGDSPFRAAAAREESDDGGYSSPDDFLKPTSEVTTRKRAFPIQVTSERPLVVRAGFSLNSEIVAMLLPGQMATVFEERIGSDGGVRACIHFEDERRASSPSLLDELGAGFADEVNEGALADGQPANEGWMAVLLRKPVLTSSTSAVSTVSPAMPLPEAASSLPPSAPLPPPGAEQSTPAPAPSPAPSVVEAPPAAPHEAAAPTPSAALATDENVFKKNRFLAKLAGHTISAVHEAALQDDATAAGTTTEMPPQSTPAPSYKRASTSTLVVASPVKHTPLLPSASGPASYFSFGPPTMRSFRAWQRDVALTVAPGEQVPPTSPKRTGAPPIAAASGPKTGWITVRKDGRKLVTSRVRVECWVRERAGLLWKQQARADKHALGLAAECAMMDPTAVGFAFGGMHPGLIHARGALVEAHKIHYSIARAGRYLLHVRLRDKARALPGSPFALTVETGDAHASASQLLPPVQPLLGEVGEAPTDGCSMVFQAFDRSGNACTKGGAKVTLTSTRGKGKEEVEVHGVKAKAIDNGNGTYTLTWMSKVSTGGIVDTKVMIDKEPVRGSPIQIRMQSTRFERTKTEVASLGSSASGMSLDERINMLISASVPAAAAAPVNTGASSFSAPPPKAVNATTTSNSGTASLYFPEDGEPPMNGVGLKTAVAGDTTSVLLRFRDEYNNASMPGDDKVSIGMSIRKPQDGDAKADKLKAADLEELEGVECRWGAEDSGLLALTYVPKGAGNMQLFIWCTPAVGAGKGVRELLPGSPFQMTVTPGAPDASESVVSDMAIEHSKSHAQTSTKVAKETVKSGGTDKGGVASSAPAELTLAGDVIIVRVVVHDRFGNPAVVPDDALTAMVRRPDGNEQSAQPMPQSKSHGQGAFDIRYETMLSGETSTYIYLHGEPIRGSPCTINVAPAAAVQSTTKLLPPHDGVEGLVNDLEQPAIATLVTYDKFGNACVSGGLRVAGRLQLVKQSSSMSAGGGSDNVILMPNNHSVTVEDNNNGTYLVKIATSIAATVKLFVNMDKDLPGSTGELAPMQLNFGGGVKSVGAPAFPGDSARGSARSTSRSSTPSGTRPPPATKPMVIEATVSEGERSRRESKEIAPAAAPAAAALRVAPAGAPKAAIGAPNAAPVRPPARGASGSALPIPTSTGSSRAGTAGAPRAAAAGAPKAAAAIPPSAVAARVGALPSSEEVKEASILAALSAVEPPKEMRPYDLIAMKKAGGGAAAGAPKAAPPTRTSKGRSKDK